MVPRFDQIQVENLLFFIVVHNINSKHKPWNWHCYNSIFLNFFLSPLASWPQNTLIIFGFFLQLHLKILRERRPLVNYPRGHILSWPIKFALLKKLAFSSQLEKTTPSLHWPHRQSHFHLNLNYKDKFQVQDIVPFFGGRFKLHIKQIRWGKKCAAEQC